MSGICKRFRPHFFMVIAHIGYSSLYFITEAAFSHGQSPHVYVTYRHFVAGIALWPFAYFLEREQRPKMTWALFIQIFVLSLVGIGLALNTYFASLKFTSPTFLSSMLNSIASITFVIAVILGLESLDIHRARGIAKIVGTIVSLAGALTMSLYRGDQIRNLGHALLHIQGDATHEDWVKGPILTITSCLTFSTGFVIQACTLKRYPAPLSLGTWMSFIGSLQSLVFALAVEHKSEAWAIKPDIGLWSIIYGGVVSCGVLFYIQLWCTKERGPVFIAMFSPLTTVMVTLVAYLVLGEELYMGSIIGAIVVMIGLYLVLWGKDKDREINVKLEEHYCVVKESNAPDVYQRESKCDHM